MKLPRILDRIFGFGDAAVTVPPMDGPLRPNRLLDEAACQTVTAPDALAMWNGQLVYSSGSSLYRLGAADPLMRFDSEIGCIAASPDNRLAIGLAGQGLRIVDAQGHVIGHGPDKCRNAVAASFSDGRLFVCEGSDRHLPAQWALSLMERGHYGPGRGTVWEAVGGGGWNCIAGGLHYPNGLTVMEDGTIVVSEAWNHRLIALDGKGGCAPLLADLPGYPSRIAPAPGGGFWLAMFAPRNQLIEFVLREEKYRTRMMAEIDPAFWIAPSLSAGRSYQEPLQGGGVKQMGILKPWAPSRSFGLAVRLDSKLRPTGSLHSRADGSRHGITSVIEADGTVYAASKGGNGIVSFPAAEWLS